MAKIKKKFTKRSWDDCCGKFCDDCKIAMAYIKKYGKKDSRKKFKKDYKKLKGKK
jgi:hypothetical protein